VTGPGRPSARRGVIWAWLLFHPGRTCGEINRGALGRRRASGAVCDLLQRMERDGQVTRARVYRAQQGSQVSLWHAVPGALAVPDGE
jgi:hypothetical protein